MNKNRSPRFLFVCSLIGWMMWANVPGAAAASESAANADSGRHSASLPYLDIGGTGYRTPRAGDGFRTQVLGEDVLVRPRDLRSVNAWKLGAQFEFPEPANQPVLPAAALYFWRQPDERHLLRAEVSGVYNNILWTFKPEDWGDFEVGLTFNNFTVPGTWNEVYDGYQDNTQELYWGYVRPGLLLGYRNQLGTGRADNMWQLSYVLEPGYFYAGRGDSTSPDMVLPRSTFELRNRLLFRYDSLERNVLSLPHEGMALGADFVHGHRANWGRWGTPGYSFGGDDRNYFNFNAYAVGATAVPLLEPERNRLITWVHAGVGRNIDRFNATRIGGGPNVMGMEYGASAMPVLPGAAIWEFYPEHYAIGAVEYRRELTWFSYLSAHGGIGYLDPFRPSAGNAFRRSEELFPWAGLRLSTGFVGDTMLMVDYAHSFNLVSQGERGSNEVMLWLSGEF